MESTPTSEDAPQVSVLLPVHNGESYLEQALESVAAQSFRNFELIVIDDGSTDRTAAILEKWKQTEPRLIVLTQGQTGIVAALNRGLELARGAFIARMDADDHCLPDRFRKQLEFLKAQPEVVAVGSDVRLIDPRGHTIAVREVAHGHEQIVAGLRQGDGAAIVHPAAMFRTEALRKLGGYRQKYRHVEDLDLYVRLLEHGKLANLPEITLEYRLHMKSINYTHARVQAGLRHRLVREHFGPEQADSLKVQPPDVGESTRALALAQWAYLAFVDGRWLRGGLYALRALFSDTFSRRVWQEISSGVRIAIGRRRRR